MLRPNKLPFLILIALLVACGTTPEGTEKQRASEKIAFDLSRLNNEGLQGPTDGLRALHYEFCIPSDQAFIQEVMNIDTTLQVLKQANGRIRCSEDEYLCLGQTHQKDFERVLHRLAQLPYVRRIQETFFEN